MSRFRRILTLASLVSVVIVPLLFWHYSAKGPDADHPRLPGPADAPYIEITPDHQLKSIHHKNSDGLSPLEIRKTPEGDITIHRTFDLEGKLINEEAFLNGKRVKVPTD